MKKIFMLLVLAVMTTKMMAQMPSVMKFVGDSKISVLNMIVDKQDDVLLFKMNSTTDGDITIPQLDAEGMSSIPSFTIKGASFAMGADRVVTFAEQSFTATAVNADGAEKTITGSSLTGTYNMAEKCMDIKIVFKYGNMPFDTTYEIKAYYTKEDAAVITGVADVQSHKAYNLMGQSYKTGNKGIVIINGKKYVR